MKANLGSEGKSGLVTFVPTDLGHREDITHRGVQALSAATIVLAEHTQLLRQRLPMINPQAKVILMAQEEEAMLLRSLTGWVMQGEQIVVVSDAGMPAVNDPGRLVLAYCRQQDLPFLFLPGPSAVSLAFALAGFRTPWIFHGYVGRSHQLPDWRDFAPGSAHGLFVPPHRLLDTLAQLPADGELFVGKDLTKPEYQVLWWGKAQDGQDQPWALQARGEFTLVYQSRETFFDEAVVGEWVKVLPSSIHLSEMAKIIQKATGYPKKLIYEWLQKKFRPPTDGTD